MHGVSHTKLKVSAIVTLPLRMCESCTFVNLGVVNELAIPVLLAKTYIDRFMKSVHQAEWKIGT